MFYHCERTRQLNERFGDLQNRIQVWTAHAALATPPPVAAPTAALPCLRFLFKTPTP